MNSEEIMHGNELFPNPIPAALEPFEFYDAEDRDLLDLMTQSGRWQSPEEPLDVGRLEELRIQRKNQVEFADRELTRLLCYRTWYRCCHAMNQKEMMEE